MANSSRMERTTETRRGQRATQRGGAPWRRQLLRAFAGDGGHEDANKRHYRLPHLLVTLQVFFSLTGRRQGGRSDAATTLWLRRRAELEGG